MRPVKSEKNASFPIALLTSVRQKGEYEFMFMSKSRTLLLGLAINMLGTVVIRLFGDHLLRPGRVAETLVLYAVSFAVTALVIRKLVPGLEPAALLMLPTLILDPFSCLFFTSLFPNLAPTAAGLFGGWMLFFCGGAVVGALPRR